MFEKSAFSGKQKKLLYFEKSYFTLKKVSEFSSNIESIDYHSFIGACSCLVDKNIVWKKWTNLFHYQFWFKLNLAPFLTATLPLEVCEVCEVSEVFDFFKWAAPMGWLPFNVISANDGLAQYWKSLWLRLVVWLDQLKHSQVFLRIKGLVEKCNNQARKVSCSIWWWVLNFSDRLATVCYLQVPVFCRTTVA